MLLRRSTLDRIVDGSVTLQFRRWKRPTVKAGGALTTAVGVLAIDSVDVVSTEEIDDTQARQAGFDSRADLLQMLDAKGRSGAVHRVRVRWAGPDPRVALREEIPDASEVSAIEKRLTRWDAASPVGPWTLSTLRVISDRPEERAGDLAEAIGLERDRFKVNVRKLKGLGLTESLEIGYRLSPRGRTVLDALADS